MWITDIKDGKRGQKLIFADNKYLISLAPEILLKSKLKIGGCLDEVKLKSLTADSFEYKAKEKALRLLSFRAHSKKELEDKIKLKFGEEAANLAVSKMEKLNLVNDIEFAKMYANELLNRKNCSLKKIVYKLARKGIDQDLIEEVIAGFDDIDETNKITKLLTGKYQGKFDDEKGKRRVVAALQRLGFQWDQIRTAFNRLNELNE